jgi:hypothetical protein
MKKFAILLLLWAVSAWAFAQRDFTFVIIGDRTGGHTDQIYEKILEKSLAEKADFYITVGDQIEGYVSSASDVNAMWDEYLGIIAGIPVPYHLAPGNHDIWDDQSQAIWKERVGTEPNYSFDYQGCHFCVLDTSRWESSDALPEDYIDWLKSDLSAHKNDRLTFVIYHKPYWYNTLSEGKEDILHQILVEDGVDAVFNGHFHNYGNATYDGISYNIIGSSGGGMNYEELVRGSFFQYAVVQVKDNSFQLTVVPLEGEERYPQDIVSVADLKFFDSLESELVAFPPVEADAGKSSGSLTLSVTVKNQNAQELKTNIVWDTADSCWTVDPATEPIIVPPASSQTYTFSAHYEGKLYPLPKMDLNYPYGEGKLYNYQGLPQITKVLKLKRMKAPTIDGKVEKKEWAKAVEVDDFCCPEGKAVTIEGSKFYLGYDDDNLYLSAVCMQKDMSSLVTNATGRDDAVYRDDCVGFFLAPQGSSGDIYQVYFNPSGMVFDQRIFTNDKGELDSDFSWNGDYQLQVQRFEDRWEIEAAIPFQVLGTVTPKPGDEWRLNFRRKEVALGSSADWQYPISYDANLFGKLVFGK